jgi:hypothetical protein
MKRKKIVNNRWVVVDTQEGWEIVGDYTDHDEARAACEEMNAFTNRYVVMYL